MYPGIPVSTLCSGVGQLSKFQNPVLNSVWKEREERASIQSVRRVLAQVPLQLSHPDLGSCLGLLGTTLLAGSLHT